MEQNQFTAECTNTDDKLSEHVRICQSADFSSLQEFSHKVLLLSHLSPTRVPLLRLIWLDVVFKLSVAPTCSCWVLRSILVTSFCQRQHVWFISSSVNHETSVCLAVRGHRASSSSPHWSLPLGQCLPSSNTHRSIGVRLSLVVGSLHNSRSLCRWGMIPSEGGGVQGKVSTGGVVEGKLIGNESIRISACTSPVRLSLSASFFYFLLSKYDRNCKISK